MANQPSKRGFPLSLTQMIFIGLAVGLVTGLLWPDVAASLHPLSTIFIRLIKSLIAPLMFSTLVIGIAGHGDLKQVGRLGLKSIVYFEAVTTVALVVGLLAVNLVKPGLGVDLHVSSGAGDVATKQLTITDVVVHTFPQSIVQAAADGEVLQIVVFTILFSLGLTLIAEEKKQAFISFCDIIADTMFKMTGFVMKYAPIGVGAAIAFTVGHSGPQILVNLGIVIATFYASLVVFFLCVLLPVALIARIPLRRFIAAVKEPAIIAFSTTSSEAALPKAFQNMEAFGIPRRIVSFVLPTGYSFNLDGSTLYLSLASVFVAQAAGVQLSLGAQLMMMLTLMLTSKGVAGVSRASLIVLAGTLATFNLPLEGVAVLLSIDGILDMGRTATNVIGNCLATAVVAKWEKQLPEEQSPALPV